MSLVQLSFIAIAFIGLFGVIGIIAVVTGRTPKAVNKRLNWKKNLDKRALKVDKSQTNFLAPDEPENEEENLSEDIEEKDEIQTDGSIKVKEEIIYEEISEEEAKKFVWDLSTFSALLSKFFFQFSLLFTALGVLPVTTAMIPITPNKPIKAIAINESCTRLIRNGPSQVSHQTKHHQSMDMSSSNLGL